jgi:hypothetical protein
MLISRIGDILEVSSFIKPGHFFLIFVTATDLVLAVITCVIVMVKTQVTELFISCDLEFKMNFPLFWFESRLQQT